MNEKLSQFINQNYLNLETFRKAGGSVKTPVWFVQDDEKLVVWTEIGSGKARRIRNNGSVRIAPCKADGILVGEWVSATALVDDSASGLEQLKRLMSKKYGFMFAVFGVMGRLRRSKYTRIQIQIN